MGSCCSRISKHLQMSFWTLCENVLFCMGSWCSRVPRESQISLNNLLKILQWCFQSCRDPQPYKSSGKLIILYVFLMLSGSHRPTKIFQHPAKNCVFHGRVSLCFQTSKDPQIYLKIHRKDYVPTNHTNSYGLVAFTPNKATIIKQDTCHRDIWIPVPWLHSHKIGPQK